MQRAAMLCFRSYCQRAMHSWRHAVGLQRTLKRGLESHEVVVLEVCLPEIFTVVSGVLLCRHARKPLYTASSPVRTLRSCVQVHRSGGSAHGV
jgi:hypothetical protein